MTTIIRLRNLSWKAGALDIRRFFQCLSIPDGGVRIIGGDSGIAFVAFKTEADASQAMLLDGREILGCPVTLLLSSKAEVQNVVAEVKRSARVASLKFCDEPSCHEPRISMSPNLRCNDIASCNTNTSEQQHGAVFALQCRKIMKIDAEGPHKNDHVDPATSIQKSLQCGNPVFNACTVVQALSPSGDVVLPSGQSVVEQQLSKDNAPLMHCRTYADSESHSWMTNEQSLDSSLSYCVSGQSRRKVSEQSLDSGVSYLSVNSLVHDNEHSNNNNTPGSTNYELMTSFQAYGENKCDDDEVRIYADNYSDQTRACYKESAVHARVSGLPLSYSYREVRKLFKACTIPYVKLVTDDYCKYTGVACIQLKSEVGLKAALWYDGRKVEGKKISVVKCSWEEYVSGQSCNTEGLTTNTAGHVSVSEKPLTAGSEDRFCIIENVPLGTSIADVFKFLGVISNVTDGTISVVKHDNCDLQVGGLKVVLMKRNAFVEFNRPEDLSRSLKLTGQMLNGSVVRVNFLSRQQFDTRMKNVKRKLREPDLPAKRLRRSDDSTRLFLVMKTFGQDVDPVSIKECFKHIQISANGGPFMEYGSDGKPTGNAVVEVNSMKDCKAALALNGQLLNGSPVLIHQICKREYDKRLSGNKRAVTPRHDLDNSASGLSHATNACPVLCVAVTGLPPSCTDQNLRQYFNQCNITHVVLPRDESGACTGVAYLKLADEESVGEAMMFDGEYAAGRKISVERRCMPESVDRHPSKDFINDEDVKQSVGISQHADERAPDLFAVISNISPLVNSGKLRKALKRCKVSVVSVPCMELDEKKKRSTRRALVEFSSREDLRNALLLHEMNTDGSGLSVGIISKEEYERRMKKLKSSADIMCKADAEPSNVEGVCYEGSEQNNIDFCVRATGLSSSDSYSRMFRPKWIVFDKPSASNKNRCNYPVAYMEFDHNQGFTRALSFDGTVLESSQGSQVSVSIISKQEFASVRDNMNNKSNRFYVCVSALQSSVDICKIFKPSAVVVLPVKDRPPGDRSCVWYLQFSKMLSFKIALSFDGTEICGGKMKVRVCSAQEFYDSKHLQMLNRMSANLSMQSLINLVQANV